VGGGARKGLSEGGRGGGGGGGESMRSPTSRFKN